MATTETAEALEQMIDAAGITAVLEALERVCYDKGDHLRAAWQDGAAGRAWDKVGTAVGVAVVRSRNVPQ